MFQAANRRCNKQKSLATTMASFKRVFNFSSHCHLFQNPRAIKRETITHSDYKYRILTEVTVVSLSEAVNFLKFLQIQISFLFVQERIQGTHQQHHCQHRPWVKIRKLLVTFNMPFLRVNLISRILVQIGDRPPAAVVPRT